MVRSVCLALLVFATVGLCLGHVTGERYNMHRSTPLACLLNPFVTGKVTKVKIHSAVLAEFIT